MLGRHNIITASRETHASQIRETPPTRGGKGKRARRVLTGGESKESRKGKTTKKVKFELSIYPDADGHKVVPS